MDTTGLGTLHAAASVIGLGAGGHSRLGQGYGVSEAHSVDLVRRAIRMGVNVLDTAQGYGTEGIVGQALRDLRDEVKRTDLIVCSKAPCHREMKPLSMAEFTTSVERSLERLGLEYLDLYYVHALYMEHVDHALDVILPGLQALKSQGLIRAAGISEHFNSDPAHEVVLSVLRRQPSLVDILMVGFNILNQSARRELLPLCLEHGIGVTCMFAVRQAFSQPAVLVNLVANLVQSGLVEADAVDLDDPLGFVVAEGHASSVTEAAYRYCRYEPGIDVVLSGTGNPDHLRANVTHLQQPPLPDEVQARIGRMFGRVDTVSGQARPYAKK